MRVFKLLLNKQVLYNFHYFRLTEVSFYSNFELGSNFYSSTGFMHMLDATLDK